MRTLIGRVVMVTALAALPAALCAQRRAAAMEAGPQHEFGIDVAFQYIDRGSGVGGGVQLAAPVDVRIGFLSRSKVMFEARGSLAYDSKGTGTAATLAFSPGVNALYQLHRGTGTHGLIHAPYLTGGLGLNIVKAGSAGTETQVAIGAGIGTRVQYESAAFRPEGYIAYAFSSGFLPHAFAIGVRAGLSFWH